MGEGGRRLRHIRSQEPSTQGGIFFIGSSTIRLWKSLEVDFPHSKMIDRDFGGTEIVASTHFAGRLIFPHEPGQIFLRADGDDIHDGRTPKWVAADFAEFERVVRARLPRVEIIYIGVGLAPSQWAESVEEREPNRVNSDMALELLRVGFVYTFDMVIGCDGRARP